VEDRFIGRISLAVGLGMCHSIEASLASQVTEVVRELAGVKLPTVVKNYGTRCKAGDDVPLNELSHLSGGYGHYTLTLDPLGEVIHCHEEVLALSHSLGIGFMVVEGTRWMGANF